MSARDGGRIKVESGVSVFGGAPFVVLRWGNQSGQLTPAEATDHALAVLHAAFAAQHDAAVVAQLHEMDIKREAAAIFLKNLRERIRKENND